MNRILLAELAFLILIAGCANEPPVQTSSPLCMPGQTEQDVMAKAQAVLEKMQFEIEKADTDQGYIRTRPLTGAQFFQFWRDDNVGQYNSAEANIQTVRRIVQMNIRPLNNSICTDCIVTVERLSLPERDIAGISRAASLYTKSTGGLQRLQLNPAQQREMTWIELGRDGRLETEILDRLSDNL